MISEEPAGAEMTTWIVAGEEGETRTLFASRLSENPEPALCHDRSSAGETLGAYIALPPKLAQNRCCPLAGVAVEKSAALPDWSAGAVPNTVPSIRNVTAP